MTCIRMVVMILLGGMSSIAYACSCGAGGGPACQEAWKDYTQAVFLGKVLGVHPSLLHWTEKVVELEVEEAYLGVSVGRVTVTTPVNGAACGYHFVTGETYLVYAGKERGRLHVSLCSHTLGQILSGRDSISSLHSLASGHGKHHRQSVEVHARSQFQA